jgi:LmbE family N-acetylglucosaminyl deacetylase
MATTVSFVAHQDDDLLFMSPDLISDIRSGYCVWVVYLTSGDAYRGMEYANSRIEGVREAYAVAAGVPNNWTYEVLRFGAHEVATNTLDNANVRLVFTFIRAEAGHAGDPAGDLYRMWQDIDFVAYPIDGRAKYTQGTFIGMIRDLLSQASPDFIRVQDTSPNSDTEHIDHIAGALFASEASTFEGYTQFRRIEFQGYSIQNLPPNIETSSVNLKSIVWNAYKPHDDEVGTTGWDHVMNRQYTRVIYCPGEAWVARTDDFLL